MRRLTAQLVTWNGARYIPEHVASLRAQTFRDWELVVIDNASTDGTVDELRRALGAFPVPVAIVQNPQNRGFAATHNQAFRMRTSTYVQLLNQDTVLAPDYFTRVIDAMERHAHVAAAQGALLRWCVGRERQHTDPIDTLGLRVLRNRRIIEWHTGEQLSVVSHARSSETSIFGVSGALAMYRRAALNDTAIDGEVLDEDFFSYKEDVDLAYRLFSAGWMAILVHDALAWHDRTAAGPSSLSDYAALGHRSGKSAFVRYHSYKNHLMMLLKNEHESGFRKDWASISWYELKKLLYCCIREPQTLASFQDLWSLRSRMLAKRRVVMGKYRVDPHTLETWFV